MRHSAQKHTVAILRSMMGLKQPDCAKLVGISPSALALYETIKLRLSEGLAYRIAIESGVSLELLRGGNLNARIVGSADGEGHPMEPYTLELFQERRAIKE